MHLGLTFTAAAGSSDCLLISGNVCIQVRVIATKIVAAHILSLDFLDLISNTTMMATSTNIAAADTAVIVVTTLDIVEAASVVAKKLVGTASVVEKLGFVVKTSITCSAAIY